MTRRRLLRGLGVLVVVVAVVHSVAWLIAEHLLEREAETRREAAAAQGWEIHSAPARRAGWPLAARLDFDEVTVVPREGNLSWHSGQMRLGVSLLRPLWLATELEGPHVLKLGTVELPVEATQLRGEAKLQGPPFLGELRARGVKVTLPMGAPIVLGRMEMDVRQDPHAGPGQTALAVTGTAQALDLPPALMRPASGFGPRVDGAAIEATVTGPLPAGPPGRTAMTVWREAGGRLSIQSLSLHWAKLDLTATAQLELDGALQPAGEGTVRAMGIAQTLDALAAGGAIPAGTARAAKAVATLMARPPDGEVALPLSLADRTLTLAGFPLARLPVFTWP